MTSDTHLPTQPPAIPPSDDAPRYRSGAAARMARMPVATLRVWERRYRVTTPELTASGQRLYSAADVRRLALIRHLTDLGHAIGALAALDQAQLQQVAATHFGNGVAAAPETNRAVSAATAPAWHVAVVGAAWIRRLQQPALQRQLGRRCTWIGPFDTLAQAADAIARSPVHAVLVHAPTLHPGWLADLDASAPRLQSLPKAVLYGFAADTLCADIAAAGVALLREPQNDTVLGQWLRVLADGAAVFAGARPPATPAHTAVPTRRWDDATLSNLASRATPIACECPRHVAELLLQLTRFETYSAECENRNAADAALHADLGRLAGLARAQLETALERVALAEGLRLPH